MRTQKEHLVIDHEQAGEILSEMVQIGRTFRVAGQHSGERSLTGTRYGFLQYLSHCDARLGELAQKLSVSAPVASRAADSLEADGLIERRTDPRDARALLLSVTEQGRERLAESDGRAVGRFAEALADWSAEDARRAIQTLKRMRGHLQEILDDSPLAPEHAEASPEAVPEAALPHHRT